MKKIIGRVITKYSIGNLKANAVTYLVDGKEFSDIRAFLREIFTYQKNFYSYLGISEDSQKALGLYPWSDDFDDYWDPGFKKFCEAYNVKTEEDLFNLIIGKKKLPPITIKKIIKKHLIQIEEKGGKNEEVCSKNI